MDDQTGQESQSTAPGSANQASQQTRELKIVKIPTPWGHVEGTVPSLLLLMSGSVLTYLVLLFFALPQKQPAILVDPVIDVVLTAQPTATPRPRLVMIDQAGQRLPLTQQQYEIESGEVVRLVIAPGRNKDTLYRWSLAPNIQEYGLNNSPFLGGEQGEITFVAPTIPGTYIVTACEVDPNTDTCATDFFRIVLVKPSEDAEVNLNTAE